MTLRFNRSVTWVLVISAMVFGGAVSTAIADLSVVKYYQAEYGNVGAGNGYIKLTISNADGSAFGLSSFASGWYGDSDGSIEVLHLEQDKAINIKVEYAGAGGMLNTRYGADFLVWDGQGTGSQSDKIFGREGYFWAPASDTWNFVATYDGTNFNIADRSIAATNNFFDVFAQLNDSWKHDKLGIGARLDFSPAAVPAPGAVLLGGLGLGLVGWIKRRVA